VETEEPADQGWELVYRKPSEEPFTSLEIEELGVVLRARLADGVGATKVGVTPGGQGLVRVVLPEVSSEKQASRLRPRIERVGQLAFEGVAHPGTPGWEGAKDEHKRLDAWWAAQDEPTLVAFNALSREAGGPPPGVLWRAKRLDEPVSDAKLTRTFLPCERMEIVHPDRDWVFTASDLGRVYRTRDDIGYPAIGFELSPERRESFGDFTEAYVDEQLAIVLDGIVLSAPVINSPLRGPSIIQGRFEAAEVEEMVHALSAGALPTPLEFVEVRPTGRR